MAPRDEVLSWYRAATETLISAPAKDDRDPESAAVNVLLQRQAKALLVIHDALGDSSPHQVNESLLTRRLSDVVSISASKFYAYRFDLLPCQWRQIHTDALILSTHHDVLCSLGQNAWLADAVLDGVVEKLDRAVITAGGAGVLGTAWVEKTLRLLEDASSSPGEPPAAKRAKRAHAHFALGEPYGRPALSPDRTCPARSGWSLAAFERYMNGDTSPRPVVFTDLVAAWPALTSRPWKSPCYLLSRTFGGRRLVPVEIGRSYVDPDWGQELVPFGAFLSSHVSPEGGGEEVGYLAQHDLFSQIPSLRGDICTPDFCWSSVPAHPADDPARNKAPVDVPLVNAWFGPARTITPLHTDAYHNLLVQVVGTKYVRLYPPWSKAMRPRGEEDGVDMSNTSSLDVGVLEGWDEDAQGMTEEEREAAKSELESEEYWECVLGEGDTLLIPMGWWHYVRSLSVSFSVSFWWN